ncbi:MAG: hypothetical protein ACHP65_06040 [Legionellales bacterium]
MIKTKLHALPLLLCSGLTFAGAMGPVSEGPSSGVFVGLGGSYNSVKLDQYLDPLIGTTNIYNGATLVASGTANGPAIPFHMTQSTFAPEAQLGYFKHFSGMDWLWGAKFAYKYVAITATDSDLVSPQLGTLTPVTAQGIGFTGRATIESVQTQVSHELDLIPFIGHSFKNSHIYLGVGPSVFDTQTHLDNVTGYADVDSTHADVSGAPTNFSSAKWMWGGVAQIGITYFVEPTWFVDINYTYAMTPHNKTNYSAPFSGTLTNGYTKEGTLLGTSTQYVAVQALGISINKVFAL